MEKIGSEDSAEDKLRYKIVRADDYTDVPCVRIVAANVATGECVLIVRTPEGGEKEESFNFGERGIRIVGRGR